MRLLLVLLCFFSSLAATDLKPWFGNEYETEIRVRGLYQGYHRADTVCPRCYKCGNNDMFTTLSAAYPFRRYCGEFEATTAFTHHQNGRWDNFRITGRYQWLDELLEDPFSFVTGITLTEPFSRALHDVSSFHHSHIECELHASIGKKYGCLGSKEYIFRYWGVVGIGVGVEGSPWVRGDASFEYTSDGVNQIRGFMHTLWGAGKKPLQPRFFKGYGNVKHQSIDLGIGYDYIMGRWGTMSVWYARRVYAHNFPEDVNLVLFQYYYPFGSQTYYDY